MDLQDFWQENKRWILGVVAGLIVYWVGGGIVSAVFGGASASGRVQAMARDLQREEYYDAQALRTAREENERLTALVEQVRQHAAFVPDEEFVLTGKGDPDLYFPEVERRVRTRIVAYAQERSVAIDERDLVWPAAVSREEKEQTLVGLCALQHAALRLVDAGEQVRQEVADAVGLQSIESMQIEKRAGSSTSRRGRRAADSEIAGLVDEYRVKFRFRADTATLQAWLEKLRSASPSIGLAPELRVTPGDQVGDPVLVQGSLAALVIRDLSASDSANQDG
ncbi:MAG: hypothetical protein O2865_14215 [Planctomycetota bacterium]|nr:hypothetical protein [Planctomycetota bacterium]